MIGNYKPGWFIIIWDLVFTGWIAHGLFTSIGRVAENGWGWIVYYVILLTIMILATVYTVKSAQRNGIR